LPFVAFFLAAALRPMAGRATGRSLVVAATVMIALAVALPWARYGNEWADRMTRQQLDAVSQVYDIVPAGSLIVSGNYNSVFGYQRYEQYQHRSTSIYLVFSDLHAIEILLERTEAPGSYLLITDSMRATAEMFGGMPPEEWDQLMADLRRQPFLELELERPGATLFRYVRGAV
jgi:hypothetical protein